MRGGPSAEKHLSITNISDRFGSFQSGSQKLLENLKDYVSNEFTKRLNKIEEKIELTPNYLKELLSLKDCLLEV